MAILTNLSPASSFPALLNLTDLSGLTPVLQIIQDGFGNNSTISLSTTSFNINTTMGGFFIDNVKLISTATQINAISFGQFQNLTTAIILPTGTTAQRPLIPTNGSIRYNTTTSRVEAYANNAWQNLTA